MLTALIAMPPPGAPPITFSAVREAYPRSPFRSAQADRSAPGGFEGDELDRGLVQPQQRIGKVGTHPQDAAWRLHRNNQNLRDGIGCIAVLDAIALLAGNKDDLSGDTAFLVGPAGDRSLQRILVGCGVALGV